MEIHNTTEDVVMNVVHRTFEEINRTGNPEKYCLCYQCRIDTICYTLNRTKPHYIVSNRGMSRIIQPTLEQQQLEADIATLVHKALRLVNHNMRPTANHDNTSSQAVRANHPVFDFPTISGRIFNGKSFEPVIDIEVCLYCEGEPVTMRSTNWQNPFFITANTPGTFSFWPVPKMAEYPDTSQDFKFAIKVQSEEYEPLQHFFNITTVSKFHSPQSYTLNRAYKLPDLYIFPPEHDVNDELRVT